MSGILIGVGVGPGDPEQMTLKAVRVIRENEVIAVPGNDAKDTMAACQQDTVIVLRICLQD